MPAEFDTNHVKNIVLLGHAGAGKTSLAESMLFEAGIISRRGTVAARNTVSDYTSLNRSVAIPSSLHSCTADGGVSK